MKQRVFMGGATAVLAIVGIAVQLAPAKPLQDSRAPDPVAASFERDLNHTPGPISPLRRESIERDELYEALNRTHWTQNGVVAPTEPTSTNTAGGTDDEEDKR